MCGETRQQRRDKREDYEHESGVWARVLTVLCSHSGLLNHFNSESKNPGTRTWRGLLARRESSVNKKMVSKQKCKESKFIPSRDRPFMALKAQSIPSASRRLTGISQQKASCPCKYPRGSVLLKLFPD